jgi:LPPG:FO 2-phospho-L-lactate transferase
VGAARLLRGLVQVVDPSKLTVIVNTGDDDEFYGLRVCPDIDTTLYTLADLAPVRRGWGLRGDSHQALSQLERLYGTAWFRLGDRDLATHIFRTDRLRSGASLSQCTADLAAALGIAVRVLPVSDDPVRTFIRTASGEVAFQNYLVAQRARPRVRGFAYRGARTARPAPGVLRAIEDADAVVVGPSNPFVSIGPILAVPGLRAALAAASYKTIAVSPLVGGKAVKGPLVAMLRAGGYRADSAAIASLYSGLARLLVVAPGDAPQRLTGWKANWPRPVEHETLIIDPVASRRLARFALEQALAPADR